jgi:lysophospholipase L1-like esterase
MSYIRWETEDGIALAEIETVYDPIATDLYNTMDAVSTIDGLFVRVKSDNLFDKTAVTAEGTTNVWWSDYIPIQVGNSYAWYSTYHRNIYFYTESKELITDKLGDNQDGVHVYAVDVTGAKYARFKLVTANLDTAMFVKGSAYPSTYERYVYGYTFSSEVVPSEMINPLFGKKLAINGDSIMYGAAYAGGFAKMIADTNGMNFENDAVSGGCLTSGQSTSGGTPAHCISTSVNAMADDADYILFDGGINDYWHNAPLGTYSDDMSVTGDTTTIYGALDTLFQSALTKWSAGQKIVFVITHKIGATWRTANGAGLTFGDYHAAIVKMCNKYSIPVCDIYSISQFNTEMPYYYTNYTSNDGTHPNENGYKYFYKTQVQNFLKTL